MLRGALDRLRGRWPAARLRVLTSDPGALRRHCPEAEPVSDSGRRAWLAERTLLGRLHGRLPAWGRRAVAGLTRGLRRRSPAAFEALLRRRLTDGESRRGLGAFLAALRETELYVVAGQASLNDLFPGHAQVLLDMLEEAQARGCSTVLLSQGLGPLSDASLRRRARSVLPRADLVAVREGLRAPSLLEELGVPRERVAITGDDAIAPAYARRGGSSEARLGVNLRTSPLTGVSPAEAATLGRELVAFALRRGAGLLSIPIASHDDAPDAEMTRRALAEAPAADASDVASVEEAVDRAGRCRVLVTSAYHAAVFALAQGVPALCLGGSPFSAERFEGLRHAFGEGCVFLRAGREGAADSAMSALEALWSRAASLREPLLAAASRQIAAGAEAIARIPVPRREAA